MSKGLVALQEIRYEKLSECESFSLGKWVEYKATDKQLDIIEKELKALDIIRKKQVNVATLICIINTSDNVNDYNKIYVRRKLTQEEYDLLKEVLL